jgi:hypothetical protein
MTATVYAAPFLDGHFPPAETNASFSYTYVECKECERLREENAELRELLTVLSEALREVATK